MALPWLRVIDTLIDVTNLALSATGRRARQPETLARATNSPGQLEAGLAHVVVAALKEAFDRDSRRLDLERERMEMERARAERALRLELARQAGEREIGRLRLVSAAAFASLFAALFVTLRVGEKAGPRAVAGLAWVLLVGALAASLAAQTTVSRALGRLDESSARDGASGSNALASWLLVCGLAAVGLAALVA
jgi:hypothetical protein